MTLDIVGGAGGLWFVLALVLGIAELVVPGVFLVFLALAAAIMGAIAVAVPDMPVLLQLLAFALWSGVAVMVGRRWYGRYPVDSEDTLLNDRGGRLVGQVVTVDVPIAQGHGRVRIGDGAWPARGADLPAGARARIVAVEGGVVLVEAMPAVVDGDPGGDGRGGPPPT